MASTGKFIKTFCLASLNRMKILKLSTVSAHLYWGLSEHSDLIFIEDWVSTLGVVFFVCFLRNCLLGSRGRIKKQAASFTLWDWQWLFIGFLMGILGKQSYLNSGKSFKTWNLLVNCDSLVYKLKRTLK